ncbi:thioredoxin [Cytophagales bacterium RKSG123]|nr:thioredoxin family protein [Xanthovirga aplysinae]MTI32682.1 thioredoxin [Xanthovirga aplysinae]
MAVEIANDQNFKELISENDKVVVKFFASWCGSCRLFSPKFKRLSNNERFSDITFLDVNAEENQATRKEAGVNNLPYFAIFKNGELVEGVASSKEDAVVELIEKLN